MIEKDLDWRERLKDAIASGDGLELDNAIDAWLRDGERKAAERTRDESISEST